MKKQKNISVSMYQGSKGYWYIRVEGLVQAGFLNKDDALWFAENRYPEVTTKT